MRQDPRELQLTDATAIGRRPSRPPPSTEAPTRLVCGLVALPALIRRLGADPDAILAAAELDPQALAEPSNRIPYPPLIRVRPGVPGRTDLVHTRVYTFQCLDDCASRTAT